MRQLALTTVDNPYHPVDEYDKWRDFDISRGHDTERRLAKVAGLSYGLTDLENQRNINAAIEDFVRLDRLGLWKIVDVSD